MADCCEPGVVHVVARQSEKATMLADLSRQANALLDHAEDVAARLVEVICDLDWALRTEQEVANGFLAQRDAARAELDEAKRAKHETDRDRKVAITMDAAYVEASND